MTAFGMLVSYIINLVFPESYASDLFTIQISGVETQMRDTQY